MPRRHPPARGGHNAGLASPKSGPCLQSLGRSARLRPLHSGQADRRGSVCQALRQRPSAPAQHRAGCSLRTKAAAPEAIPQSSGAARHHVLVRQAECLDWAAQAALREMRARSRRVSCRRRGRLEGRVLAVPRGSPQRRPPCHRAASVSRGAANVPRHPARGASPARPRSYARQLPRTATLALRPPIRRRRVSHPGKTRGRGGAAARPCAASAPGSTETPRTPSRQ